MVGSLVLSGDGVVEEIEHLPNVTNRAASAKQAKTSKRQFSPGSDLSIMLKKRPAAAYRIHYAGVNNTVKNKAPPTQGLKGMLHNTPVTQAKRQRKSVRSVRAHGTIYCIRVRTMYRCNNRWIGHTTHTHRRQTCHDSTRRAATMRQSLAPRTQSIDVSISSRPFTADTFSDLYS